MDYYKRYQEIIADYNREKDRATVEETFAQLMDLANNLDAEQRRAVEEGLTEDELALFDLLRVREDQQDGPGEGETGQPGFSEQTPGDIASHGTLDPKHPDPGRGRDSDSGSPLRLASPSTVYG